METSQRQKEIANNWKKLNLLSILQKKNKDGHKYFFLDGPPYANFQPHVGHIRNTVYKDMYIRWEFMKGKNVLFQPGFDTHGLPIENMVEKKLNLKSKKDIEKMGISNFMKKCKESAALNKDLWMDVYDLLGSWYAWKEPYLTYNNEYIESAWWAFNQMWEKDLVYEGKKPVFWCPQCQTALAGYETTDSYKQVSDPMIFVKFPVIGQEKTFLLVYTTTPWTLPANVAIAAAPKEDYVKVATSKGNLILAKERLELLDNIELEYKIIESFKGKALDGLAYDSALNLPVQDKVKTNEKSLKVYMSIPILKERISSKIAMKKGLTAGDIYEEFVSVKEGTGLVHSAPGHGKTDNELGKQYNLPVASPLDDQCLFTADAGEFAGIFVKDADKLIIEKLDNDGKLLYHDKLVHSYPLCWRCKSPLIYRLSTQWFFKIDPIKEKMLEINDTVNWQPDFAKERLDHWIANADDWNFSRQRYWGIPIPIWKSKSGKIKVIQSKEELSKLSINPIPENFDLHTANEVVIKDPDSGEEMHRINDIFDVWYDSGSAPYASLHYPFKNKELFDAHYPISRINESQDQVRGWFYHLMFCSVGIFDQTPYKTVSMPGWVLDEKGEKMSKSLGNVLWAKETLEKYGADAIRFYYCWDIAPGLTQKFSLATLDNDIRRFFSIWNNLVNLAVSQNKKFSEKEMESLEVDSLEIEDKWILSKLHSTIKKVRVNVESFSLHFAGRSLSSFLMDDLSRTYVQFVRERLDSEELPNKLISYALWQIAQLSAAITPFQSEDHYKKLKSLVLENPSEESVHLRSLPAPQVTFINESLEEFMSLVLDVITAILSCRDQARVGLRWPLRKVIIDCDKKTATAISNVKDLLLKQVNIKELEISSFSVDYDVSANYRSLGKEYSDQTTKVANLIKTNKEQVKRLLVEKEIELGGFKITKDFVVFKKLIPDGFTFSDFKSGAVYLSTHFDEELELEGFARELSRRVQQLRKELGMLKEQRIKLVIVCAQAKSFSKFAKNIAAKVGATSLEFMEQCEKQFDHSLTETIKKKSFTILMSQQA